MPVNIKSRASARRTDRRDPAQPSRASAPVAGANSPHHGIMVVIGLALAARLARDSRSYESVIMVVIGVAAVAGLAKASRARSFARLVAWDKRRNPRGQRNPKTRQAVRGHCLGDNPGLRPWRSVRGIPGSGRRDRATLGAARSIRGRELDPGLTSTTTARRVRMEGEVTRVRYERGRGPGARERGPRLPAPAPRTQKPRAPRWPNRAAGRGRLAGAGSAGGRRSRRC